MGKNGKPTVVDFTNQFAIAVVLPKTDTATSIQPVSLKKGKDNSMVFEYKVSLGNTQSYTIRPFLLLVIDKKFDGKVRLESIE